MNTHDKVIDRNRNCGHHKWTLKRLYRCNSQCNFSCKTTASVKDASAGKDSTSLVLNLGSHERILKAKEEVLLLKENVCSF